jgi:hypothetical protein
MLRGPFRGQATFGKPTGLPGPMQSVMDILKAHRETGHFKKFAGCAFLA